MDLVDLATAPIPEGGIARIRARVQEAGEGDAFVGVYFPETLVCFTGVVVAGELVTWSMFTAPSESAAKAAATGQLEVASAMVRAMRERSAPALAAAMGRLKQQ